MDAALSHNVSASGTCFKLRNNGKPVVVLIHGLGLTQDMWRWQLDALSENYSVLTYDLTGMGQSAPPDAIPSLTMFARQLSELLKELKIERAIIAGFSLGGMIARRFAMDYPKKVIALAILNSAYKRDADAHDAIQSRVYQAQKDGPHSTVQAALSRWFTKSFSQQNPKIMNWVRATILANEKEIYPQNYQVLVDGVDELAAPQPPIFHPTLVMTAEEDYGNSVEMAHQIAAEIANSKTVILPKLRHMAMVEAPELFNMHLLNFLGGLNVELSDG